MMDELFSAIDDKNSGNFISLLAPDCVFRFGNGPSVKGVSDIEKSVSGFFDSISSLSHKLVDVWEVKGGLVCHGDVSYTRKNGSVLTVPFSNIFKLSTEGIVEYLIFADISELYAE